MFLFHSERERDREREMKQLSAIANDLLQRCAEILNTSDVALINEFDLNLKSAVDNYFRRLVEFSSSKAIEFFFYKDRGKISDANFSRFTFDMMLAWEIPINTDEDFNLEKEGLKEALQGNAGQMYDDIPLFYSDIMPLLVDEEKNVGEDAFVWLGSIIPLVADVTNARFTFEILTESTASRLHYPAYDRFLKEIDKYIKYLQKQRIPKGFEFSDDEIILHVEGNGMTPRVVRHIGMTNWPGRLTLTNLALYFEASRAFSYENALRIDLSSAKEDHQLKATSTGPFGSPLFDKAITYKSSQLTESMTLEFPEMGSSTRRDHWLALIKEVMLMHQFISKFKDESINSEIFLQAWEVQARTILGVMRLHAARELLRMAPPPPIYFLIFALFDEVPKGDYVLEELYTSLRKEKKIGTCSASFTLKSLNMMHPIMHVMDVMKGAEITPTCTINETSKSLETIIEQTREEHKETRNVNVNIERIKDEGITDSILVLAELLSPLKKLLIWFQTIISWEKPVLSLLAFVITLISIYKEWFGPALAALLLFVVGMMLRARYKKLGELDNEIVISPPPSNQTTVESMMLACYGIKNIDAMVKATNITILKIKSILVSKASKHADMTICGLSTTALLLIVIPFKFILIGLATYIFMSNMNNPKDMRSNQENRRLKEWWEMIPITPARIITCPQ